MLSSSIGFDFMLPFGEPEYACGSIREHISAIAFDATYHRRFFNKVYVFAGGNYTSFWFRLKSDADSVSSHNKFDKTLGLTTGAEYQVLHKFAATVTYRPAIVLFDTKQYWHTLFASLRFELFFKRW